MQTVRIKGYPFQFSTPFQAGTVLTKGEAQALNQLRLENVTNNLRDEVKKQVELLEDGELLSTAALTELQTRFTKYDREYQFLEKHIPRPRKGLLETEAMLVASERVDVEAAQSGRELSDEERTALVKELVLLPAVLEEARERAGARQAALRSSLSDLLA